MKKIIIALSIIASFSSCTDLDLNPLSEGSSENWYSNESEINLSLNDLYRQYAWDIEINWRAERMSDNWSQRQTMNDYAAGAITSNWSVAELNWESLYKAVSRANTILENLKKADNTVSAEKKLQFEAEARFMRANAYGRLAFLWGDVPFYTNTLSIEDAFKLGRTDKKVVIKQVYDDLDFAAKNLPKSYAANQLSRATKGAALAFKTRYALYFKDYSLAKEAAKACMELNQYSLYPDFGEYFKSSTRNATETIFAIPRSTELGEELSVKNFIPRTAGGSAVAQPSWDLFFSFYASDGKPIDESPLFDPKKPFENRDPRLKETIVEFGSEFLGYIYDPNPYATTVLNTSTGSMVKNNDTRAVDTYASYNGLSLKKGVDADWSDDYNADTDIIIMRYADILLMYAEAKIELNELDQSVADAINLVRKRAYKDAGAYPIVTVSNQTELRKIVRAERRMEFAWENRRLDDLIRWELADEALTIDNYGFLDPAALKSKIVDKGLWVFPSTPQIDDNGLVDLKPMFNKGQIKKLATRNFNSRQYLWPIPYKEISINPNIKQNPGY
ncbi:MULTISPECIES: RagB/SusD family nutrient uptake outer membrane protein [Empedobacter]|uniref:RagB/SusD family nutrient uptake outer membrane protein n=1 Tax=Empedobacter TaxID=59734 RepID=UPI0025C6FFB8|nr:MULTISPECIES: RagB/SusD family nutrient uptake outer membrane protein [unclassified Empedobacter]